MPRDLRGPTRTVGNRPTDFVLVVDAAVICKLALGTLSALSLCSLLENTVLDNHLWIGDLLWKSRRTSSTYWNNNNRNSKMSLQALKKVRGMI